MKKSVIIVGILIEVATLIVGIYLHNKNIKQSETIVDNPNSGLAIMIENNKGTYEHYNGDTWPIDRYVYSKSICDDGSSVTWNDKEKTTFLTTNKSSKCTVYFNQMPMADYIKSLYTTDGEKGLYYHDGTGTYSTLEAADNSYRYAGPNSVVNNYVCFGSDANSCPRENLYRIIGIFDEDKDGTYQVKLIKADYANETQLGTETIENGTYYKTPFGSSTNSNELKDAFYHRYKGSLSYVSRYCWQFYGSDSTVADWPNSLLNKVHLNSNYYNTYDEKWKKLIDYHTWYYKGGKWTEIVGSNSGIKTNAKNVYQIEIKDQKDVTQAYIGLMYISDYLYAASSDNWSKIPFDGNHSYTPGSPDLDGNPQGNYQIDPNNPDYKSAVDNNWMYLGLLEWTITPRTDIASATFTIHTAGHVDSSYVGSRYLAVRPTFYLKDDVKITGGTGSSSDPYRINE